MSSIIHPAPVGAGATSIICRFGEQITGLREVSDEATSLSVLAFQFDQVDLIARIRPLAIPAFYILTGGHVPISVRP